MDTARSLAYGRVIKTIDADGSEKLTAPEQQIVRSAADGLLFDGEAYDELAAVEDLAQQLVDAERWTAERAKQLVDDVAGCGPTVNAR